MSDNDKFDNWVVYASPLDFPGEYVARRWFIQCGAKSREIGAGPHRTDDILHSKDLSIIRKAMMDRGLVRLERNEDDEPQILETWI